MKNNKNKGFSLVEMIVTVLIVAVLATSSALLYNIVQRRSYLKCAKNTVDALNVARQAAMVRELGSDSGLVIYYYNRNYYAQVVFFDAKEDKIEMRGNYNLGGGSLTFLYGKHSVAADSKMNKNSHDITLLTKASEIKTYVDNGDILLIMFNKNNGAMKLKSTNPYIDTGAALPDFEYLKITRSTTGSTVNVDYSEIGFSDAGRAYLEYK